MQIPAPNHIIGDMNRSLECEQHFAAPIRDLLDQAVTAGWTAQEVFIAIEEVVKDLRSAYKEDPNSADTTTETPPSDGLSAAG
jgi:hypothetical protein